MYLIRILSIIIWLTWGGFAFAQLWFWFMVPLGVPAINAAHAAGLMVTVSFTRAMDYANLSAAVKDSMPDKAELRARQKLITIVGLIVSVLCPAVGLLMGWVIQAFA